MKFLLKCFKALFLFIGQEKTSSDVFPIFYWPMEKRKEKLKENRYVFHWPREEEKKNVWVGRGISSLQMRGATVPHVGALRWATGVYDKGSSVQIVPKPDL